MSTPERNTSMGEPPEETVSGPDPEHVLTWRQRKILNAIRDSVAGRGYPPSVREIADAVQLSSISSVTYQLAVLERRGFLYRDPGRPRALGIRMPGPGSRDAGRKLAAIRAELAAAARILQDPALPADGPARALRDALSPHLAAIGRLAEEPPCGDALDGRDR